MKAKKNGLEIEKRYLLRKIPVVNKFDECQSITQYYTPEGRFRQIISKGKFEYIKTIKKDVSEGVAGEKEWDLTEAEFKKAVKKSTKKITKIRYIKKAGKLKWEIDIFDSINVIIAEVELKTKKELKTIKVPKFIKDVLILDITGIKAFSNFNLADKTKKK
jgi:CYTH domain-containing protein